MLQGVAHKLKDSHDVIRCLAVLMRVGGAKTGVNSPMGKSTVTADSHTNKGGVTPDVLPVPLDDVKSFMHYNKPSCPSQVVHTVIDLSLGVLAELNFAYSGGCTSRPIVAESAFFLRPNKLLVFGELLRFVLILLIDNALN